MSNFIRSRFVVFSLLLSLSAAAGLVAPGVALAARVRLDAVALSPTTVTGGAPTQGTVTLSGPAPTGGAVVTLSSSNTAAATVPASVTVAAGARNATFAVTTYAVTATATATISGDYGRTKSATLTVQPAAGTPGGGGTPPPPAGGTYYVSPAGSDSNAGTQALPFRTIQKAANVVNPGDTVIVMDGVYTDTDGDGAIVTLNRGGDMSNWVTFKSQNTWGAKLDGQNNTSDTGWRFSFGGNYIRVEGFEVYGVGKYNGSGSGFELYNGGHDVQLVGNHIHDIGRLCTDTTNGEVGIFIQQDRVVVDRNRIHDIGRFAPAEGGCSPATLYYKNHDHGIYIDQGNDVTVSNNVFYNMKRGWAIQVFPGPSDRIAILNNTFAFENPYNDGHIIMAASGMNNRIENNVFYDPKNAAIYFYSGTQSNMVVSNNITYLGTIRSGTASGVTFTGNLDNTDPMLVSPSALNFDLQPGSPAIDFGMSLPEVVSDYASRTRPQANGHDAGAYEYPSGN